MIISSVIAGSSNQVGGSQPDPTDESSMTTANPLARYSGIGGALASSFANRQSYTTPRDLPCCLQGGLRLLHFGDDFGQFSKDRRESYELALPSSATPGNHRAF
jgi:hypothetical protein